jgi:hypothetical protein
VKKLTKTVKKLSRRRWLMIVVGAALVAGSVVLLIGGGDDETSSSPTKSTATAPPGAKDGRGTVYGATSPVEATPGATTTTPSPKRKPAPPAKPKPPVTFASDRAHKNYALAQATGSIKRPTGVSMRVGAAPKQPVTINWNVVCLFAGGAKTTSDTLTRTPPITVQLTLPPGQAETCTISAQAQLTLAGVGRVKVFLVGQR